MSNFGEILKDLREDKNITQEIVAKYLKVSRATISKYESGNRSPDHDTIKLIAKYFNVTTDYLFGLTKIPNINETISEDVSYYGAADKDLKAILKDEKFIRLARLIKENKLDIDIVESIIRNMLNIKKGT